MISINVLVAVKVNVQYIKMYVCANCVFLLEPIKIIKHPKSQTVKEGSKVQLECKLEKKSQHFLYQWYRDDGSAVIGKSESVLVLDPVELKDFGSYHCRVSYEDSFGEGKVTKPAKLEVRPIPGRNGMSEYWQRVLGSSIKAIVCIAPTLQSSIKFRDFDKSLSNLAVLLILRRSSCPVVSMDFPQFPNIKS